MNVGAGGVAAGEPFTVVSPFRSMMMVSPCPTKAAAAESRLALSLALASRQSCETGQPVSLLPANSTAARAMEHSAR